jgi:putative tryptophan/tyrosine transport system substrate-binding protein
MLANPLCCGLGQRQQMQFGKLKRREFITLFGGAAVAWSLAARGEQRERMRRIGVLMNTTAEDAEGQARLMAFGQALAQLGWIDGGNARIDIRWGAGDAERFRTFAGELVALAPDVILAASGATVPPLLAATRTVPIVFAQTGDPVGAGYVASLARPGGNATGFTHIDFGMTGKWLELLKQIQPQVRRAAVIRDPSDPSGIGQWGAIHAMAPTAGIEVIPINVRDIDEMERAITAVGSPPNAGLVVTAGAPAQVHREKIISLAARHRLAAVYPFRYYVLSGGLISYGPDTIDVYRLAAGYVDRILKGEKPDDLPVQAPTKYELVINLKTAKALGLTMPDTLLTTATEVIE